MKRMGLVRTLGLTAMIVAAVGAQASAGVKLTFSNGGGGSSLIAQAGRLSELSGVTSVVLDCKSGRVTEWDTKKRLYWQGSSDELVAGLQAMMADLQKQMAAYGSMMAGGGQKSAKAQATSLGTRTFAGFKAVGYRVSGSGPMGAAQLESWYSSDIQQKIEHETGRCDAFTVLTGMGAASLGADAEHLTMQLAKAHGTVVSQSISMMGRSTLLSRLQNVETVDAPASSFAVPEGYTRIEKYADYLKREGR